MATTEQVPKFYFPRSFILKVQYHNSGILPSKLSDSITSVIIINSESDVCSKENERYNIM